jgi:hypothetical protein
LGSFFPIGAAERLRSFHETASYVSNSAVDSPGVTRSAFEGDGRVWERVGETPLTATLRRWTSELAPATERRSRTERQ